MGKSHELRLALVERGIQELTPAEAAVVSGLPVAQAQEALFELVTRYPGGFQVGERGTLRFRFASLTEPRREEAPGPLQRLVGFLVQHAASIEALVLLVLAPAYLLTLACHAAALASATTWLPVRLVGYAVAVPAIIAGFATFCQFLLAPFAVLTGLQCLLGLAGLAPLPVAWLWEGDMIPWVTLASFFIFLGACGGFGTWLVVRHYVFGQRNLAALGLGAAVAGTVFGPLPAPAGRLEEERRLTALIAHRAGVLTLADLMGLFGWRRDEVEAQLGRILAAYGGEAVVTEDGALLLRFDELGRAAAGGDARPAYERELAPPAFWDASARFRQGLALASAVGLAGLILNPSLAWFPSLLPWGPNGLVAGFTGQGVSGGLGLYPYLALGLPILLRWPLWRAAVGRHARRLRFLTLLRLAVAPPHGRYMKQVPPGVAALGGTVDLDHVRADGRMLVTFPEHQRAGAAAARLRAARQPAGDEAVVFDSEGVSGL